MRFAQLAEFLQSGFEIVAAIREAAVGKRMRLGVAEVGPLDALDIGFAQRQKRHVGGRGSLHFGRETAAPVAARDQQIRIGVGVGVVQPSQRSFVTTSPNAFSFQNGS